MGREPVAAEGTRIARSAENGTADVDPVAGDTVTAILAWWSHARVERDRLAWRRTRDPWAVLVSEVMLVQTQVSRVAERFETVIDRFPTPGALAGARTADLLQLWSGLGYNRRAVALHRAATAIVERHGGDVPASLPALLALPGVGAYTARAVLAIAFGTSVAPIDTNVGRVLARAIAGRALGAREAQALGDRLVPAGRGRDWALASIDFGSLVCRSRRPACGRCPVAGSCQWRLAGGLADPARASAYRPRAQASFPGSDREFRGRIVRLACDGPIERQQLPAAIGLGPDPERAYRLAAALVGQGVLAEAGGRFTLP